MKKLLSIILTLVIALSMSVSALATTVPEITVNVNGKELEFEMPPFIENDVTLVPMRAIFEALGAEVIWRSGHITAKKRFVDKSGTAYDDTVFLTIDSDEMLKRAYQVDIIDDNDPDVIKLEAPARLVNDFTFVPLRAVSEALDCDVQWNGDTIPKTITITYTDKSVSQTYMQELMSNLPQDENYVISPYSLKTAMMMAANGAEGETQKEILDTFNIETLTDYNSGTKHIIEKFNNSENGEINTANSIWFNKDYYGIENADFSDSFKKVIAESYDGTAETVTKENNIERVNEWVEDKTKGKITNLLSEQNRDYLAALVNTIYMKANWKKQFEAEDTYKDIFTDINDKKTETDFMHQTDTFGYYEDSDTKIVALPYINNLSMYVVLGDAKDFDVKKYNMNYKKVILSIPKFKIEYNSEFVNILKNMGISKAFADDNHDFDLMLKNVPEPIKIGSVLQKAIIEVDEQGTEAAAATAVIMTPTGAIPVEYEIVEFKADEPFTYYIIDNMSDEVLFAGRYVKVE
ncbi:MAG: hypothetical protein J1F01_07415 [Oscillospiraceae bacterium]|nr:hypothetical protein [Oscillospiraceae bacterium]